VQKQGNVGEADSSKARMKAAQLNLQSVGNLVYVAYKE
jgi:hypothetical protein